MSRRASGLQAWAVQRLSALYLAGFTIYLIATVVLNPPADAAIWQREVHGSIVWLLFVLALCWHAWIGIRDVIIDYVHPPLIRLGVLTLFGSGLLVCVLWGFKIILSV